VKFKEDSPDACSLNMETGFEEYYFVVVPLQEFVDNSNSNSRPSNSQRKSQ
jgi:hypothetical protein